MGGIEIQQIIKPLDGKGVITLIPSSIGRSLVVTAVVTKHDLDILCLQGIITEK